MHGEHPRQMRPTPILLVAGRLRRMSRPVWNLGDGLEQLSYAATSFSGQ